METTAGKPKHSVGALFLLVIDLLLAVCACLELGIVSPVFAQMFQDFGVPLPVPTQILLNISRTIMAFHGFGFSLLFCFVLWMIIRTYLALHRRGDRKTLVKRLWIMFFFFVVIIAIMTVAIFIPGGGMGPVVGDQLRKPIGSPGLASNDQPTPYVKILFRKQVAWSA